MRRRISAKEVPAIKMKKKDQMLASTFVYSTVKPF